jgi:general stress protein 26
MVKMELREAKRQAQDLLKRTWVVYVATIGENGFPQVRAVENLSGTERFPHLAKLFEREEFEFATLFSTIAGFNKLKEIQADPRGSIYYCLEKEWRGLRMEGRFEIVNDKDIKRQIWNDDWKTLFPEGSLDPRQTVVRFTPRKVVYYDGTSGHVTLEPHKNN